MITHVENEKGPWR